MTDDPLGQVDACEAVIEAAIDVAMQRGGDSALRANGLAVTSRRAMDRLVEALTTAGRTTPRERRRGEDRRKMTAV